MLFRLTAVHHISDQLVPEGTLVGDGTPFPISGPSMFMDPVDDEAKVAYEKHMTRWAGKRPPAEILTVPSAVQPGQRVPGAGPPPPKPPSPASAMAPGAGGPPKPEGVKVQGD